MNLGGSLYINYKKELNAKTQLHSNIFERNSALKGGALKIINAVNSKIVQNNFTRNIAKS